MRDETSHNLIRSFPLFSPYEKAYYPAWESIIVKGIQEFVPALHGLAIAATETTCSTITIDEFIRIYATETYLKDTSDLGDLLNKHRSDKASKHEYHRVYAVLLAERTNKDKILEIGLGTNNTDVLSTMGREASPGASLRAFRDFLPNAQVIGVDIDERILFEDERIHTFCGDQMDFDSLVAISPVGGFDLMIDDGLHLPTPNLNSLAFFLPRLKPMGWAVIEDIPNKAVTLWQALSLLMPDDYRCHIVKTKSELMFLVQRRT